MKRIVGAKTGNRGFYDTGRVKDMSQKQFARFQQSYGRYVREYDKRAAAGEMFQKKLTPNQYLNEYAAIRAEYVAKGVDPGKRHIPEQIARGQQYERGYISDLHFYQELKALGTLEDDIKFNTFRRTARELFTEQVNASIQSILSQTNAYYKAQGWKSSEIAEYIGRYYYGS